MTKRMKLMRAIRRGDFDGVRALVASGASVHSTRMRGILGRDLLSPLEEAVLAGAPSIVSFLLSQGVDPNGGERPGAPLAYACGRGALPIIELLVECGALVNPPPHPRRRSPLVSAVTQRRVEIMEWLLARGAKPDDVFDGTVVLNRVPAPILLSLIEAGGKAPEDVERRVRAGTW
jgi:ankyrin repeat protein